LITNTSDFPPCNRNDDSVHPTRSRWQRTAVTIALALMLVLLWTLTHRFGGLTRDAHLYAYQALARIHPALASDIYLKNTSQDRFTIFSPLYAAFISAFGLNTAGALLLGLCAAWFLAGAWFLARALSNAGTAWLAVAMLIVTVGHYGAYDVFHFSEDYLTARSLAEALVVTALACHFCGWRWAGLLVGALAMFVHPLVALPGLLLLTCSWAGPNLSVIGACAGVLAALAISTAALVSPLAAHYFVVMNPAWLEVVRERSQFLFLQLWRPRDWDLNARPLICVAIAAATLEDPRLRKICISAALVGAAGLAVALVAGLLGPVAILLQGQAWRWLWITGLIGVILLPATALRMWRDCRCGPLCALLLLSAWTFSQIDGSVAASLTLLLWLSRERINRRIALYLRWAAVGLAIVILGWTIFNCRTLLSPTFDFRDAPMLVQRLRNIFGLTIPAVLLIGPFWFLIRRCRSLWVPALCCAALAATSAFMLPLAFRPTRSFASAADVREFSGWRKAIPPTANVYVADGGDSPIFAWFVLRRPSYLSVDQSAGVVFSRTTAREVRHRARDLRPLMPRDWRLLSKIRKRRLRKPAAKNPPIKALTPRILVGICKDPLLGFVIARQNVGFGALSHEHAGPWKNWNLYNCAQVRAAAPAA